MLKSILSILFIGFVLNVQAYTKQPRFDFQTRYTLNEKWVNLSSLGYVRYVDDKYPGYRIQLRTSLSRFLTSKTDLKFGLYTHYINDLGFGRPIELYHDNLTDINSESTQVKYLEIRPWIGYNFGINTLNWLLLDNFIRYEYRGHISFSGDYQNYSTNVLRYRVLAIARLFKSQDDSSALQCNVGAEFFASVTAGLGGLNYNRIRLLSGVSYKSGDKWDYSVDFGQEYNQSGQVDLSDLNTLIIFMKVRRTLFSNK